MQKSTTLSLTFSFRLPERTAVSVVLLSFALLLAGCGQPPAPAKPVDIAKDDICARCRQPITDIQYAAEFITKDGFVRKFDDMGCMLEHARKLTPGKIAAFFAMDYDRKVWMKAEEAVYVRSERFKTPNDGGILAFASKERAQSLASQYEAEVLDFSSLLRLD
jgi:copper chaperone NosL